ncbi:MAG: PspC domain-containing protein [Bacteroidota bacterium]
MSTRSRPRQRTDDAEVYDDEFSLVTDEDIAAYMAEQELEEEAKEEKSKGFWNLQTASGMGLIGLGAAYSLQLMGLLPLGTALLQNLVEVLPIFAAVLIMLTGFGVLSWSPAARRRKKARERAIRRRRQRQRRSARGEGSTRRKTVGRKPSASNDTANRAFEQAERALRAAGRGASRAAKEAQARRAAARRSGRTKLLKDRANRKLTGVAAGMANYFGIDPTVVRIGWVIATIFSQGGALIPYIILSFVLNDEDEGPGEDPIIRLTSD